MALEDSNVVDAAGIEKATGFIVLTITDAWDWTDEQAHINALQAKLNNYVQFVKSGEILDTFPEAAIKPVIIDLYFQLPLPPIGEHFLRHANSECEKHGIKVRYEIFPDSFKK